jgi:hypothetical protein
MSCELDTELLKGTAPKPRFFANPLPPYHKKKVRRFEDEMGFETGFGVE